MSVYSDYTTDEQRVLTQAISAAAVVVSVASPGPKADTVSEGFAAAEYVLDSHETNVANTLISSVIFAIRDRLAADQPFPDYSEVVTTADAGARARQRLEAAAALLTTRTSPEEAEGYKEWLVGVATATSHGAREDRGFLGRGGVEVNDAERAAIAEVRALLGLPA
jgi:hypothetical protein